MNLAKVQPVVDAVLYEGYILYPYRATSTKNRQRWTFGGVYPRAWFDASGGADPWQMQTQCLIEGGAHARLEIRLRFLQPVQRQVGELRQALDAWPPAGKPAYRPVDSLTVGGERFQSWQEAVERDVSVADCRLADLLATPTRLDFGFEAEREVEPLAAGDGPIQAVLERSKAGLAGRVSVAAETVGESAHRVTVRIENNSRIDGDALGNREDASPYSFASTHTILAVEGGAFVSLMDPPGALAAAARACDNQGAYPVLVGEPGARDILLASPIILYDYPQVAPESPGDLFDATEIDEILSLNILAMTDQEKAEMAATDPRAAALLARTEGLGKSDFMRMHGVLRKDGTGDPEPGAGDAGPGRGAGDSGLGAQANPLEPEVRGPQLAYYSNGATALKVGDRVRLRPKPGGDVMDLVLKDKIAVIEAIERDFEDQVHVAVVVEDDPGRHLGMERMPGHRFFFSPDEIEPAELEGLRA
ncbi:hypothetical protein [Spectribacter hydrogenoxidans]|uniref:Uncharacterized protein n=1 Tax=Spectribacter hydrogenoxidans TaxID=3075608 RepID=A0ABU3C413_9GAMM|nr:hypothetical protein [Salinisphaera sp. W335]MDT0636280.1 hypothetical protein [Salinisphaera sp. W335]